MKYTKQYFIDKFEAIPDDEIGRVSIDNHCALWHCGAENYAETEESMALALLLNPLAETEIQRIETIFRINDFDRRNPKQNILAALRNLPDKE